MKLTITIDLDNAAFLDAGREEVKRILIDLASRLPPDLRTTGTDIKLRDINGNTVGKARIK